MILYVALLIGLAVLSYLLGSLNFGVILSKKLENDDVRNHGSGNAGTTNMMRSYGKGVGMLTIFGDIAKVFVAIYLCLWILEQTVLYNILKELVESSKFNADIETVVKLFAGLFAVIGHIFPCYFGFKGGKGVATSGGMVIAIDWRIALILLVIFFITILLTKYVSLGSILMAIFFPVFMGIFYKSILLVCLSLVFTIIVIVAHRENVKRLLNHTENKIGSKKTSS